MSYKQGTESLPTPLPVVAPTIARIADTTYRNYDGPIQPHIIRWWVVASSTIRTNVKRVGFWLPAVLILLTYLLLGALFYFNNGIRTAMAAQGMAQASTTNQYATAIYNIQSTNFVALCLFVAALVIGSASIAADNRANALLVYLSKPLTRLDYLIGKWVGIFLLLFGVLVVPTLLFFLFLATVYFSDGFFKDNATLIFRVLLACTLLPAIHTSLIIGFSAWSKSARTTGASYAAFYLISILLTQVIGLVMRSAAVKPEAIRNATIVLYSSPVDVINGLNQYIYGIGAQPSTLQSLAESAASGGRRHRRGGLHRGDTAPPSADPPADDTVPTDGPAQETGNMPVLWALLPLTGLYFVIPLAAATYKVRAVEVISG